MSDAAKTLLHYASNAQADVADNGIDASYCLTAARLWAGIIIAGAY